MSDIVSVQTTHIEPIKSNNKMGRMQRTMEFERPSPSEKRTAELKKACSEMESLFINYLLKEMRTTVPKSEFIGGGIAEEMYTSMSDSQLAKELSSKGGIGLSSYLFDALGGGLEHLKSPKEIK